MCLYLNPLKSIFTFFSNITMLTTLVYVVFMTYCGSIVGQQINSHKKKLACLHLLYEVSFSLNLVTVIVYWGLVHADLIVDYDGAKRLDLYLKHIFPAISLCVSQLSVESLYFRADHFKLFLPFYIIYAIINYFATLDRGQPLYPFMTWESYHTPLFFVAVMVAHSLAWIVLANLTKSMNKNIDDQQIDNQKKSN